MGVSIARRKISNDAEVSYNPFVDLSTPLGPGFISKWDTTNTSPGSSAANQIRLPLRFDGTYNFNIDWGDGSSDTITVWNQAETTHTYAVGGVKEPVITGQIEGWQFAINASDIDKMLNLIQWGSTGGIGGLKVGNSDSNFLNCSNMEISAEDQPDFTGKTQFSAFIQNCASIVETPAMASWDVSDGEDFSLFWSGCSLINPPIQSWSMANATNVSRMVLGTLFNRNVGGWSISNITLAASFADGTPLTPTNLGALYVGWALQTLQTFVPFGAANTKYPASAAASRAVLAGAPNNWSITDDGQVP